MESELLFDDAKVFATARTLANGYCEFMNYFKQDARCYRLEPTTISDVVERYWRDVDRLHRYHSMKRIDRHKIAGYLTYWISKLRPIAVIKSCADIDNADISTYINELYAIFVALGRLCETKQGKEPVVKSSLLNTLLYNLRYRPVTGDMLSMVYFQIEETSRN
ncbi:MAG: hypothetical protein FWE57_07560 [Chitinispirillia bacterium]|nr:hypothetical protein [Chitinispirillia bacterium]